MRLQDRLPDSVTVGRKKYRVDLDFRNILNMMDIMSDKTLLIESKLYLALKCVMRRVPRKIEIQDAILRSVTLLCFNQDKKFEDEKPSMSFRQDADLIVGAFRQAYGINLYRDKLHWLEFRVLLGCLPEGSRYSEVIEIRTKPLPAPTKYNAEERRSLIKAKARYALEVSEEERETRYKRSVSRVAESLRLLAERGDKH